MWGPSDITVVHGVIGVDSRWWQPCSSTMTTLLWLAHSQTFRFGVGVLKDVTTLTVPGSRHSPDIPIFLAPTALTVCARSVALANMNRYLRALFFAYAPVTLVLFFYYLFIFSP